MTFETFTSMYQRYRSRVNNSMIAFTRNPNVAEDVTASAFAKAYRYLDKFKGESSFYTWVHAIALNEARRALSHGGNVSLDAFEDFEPPSVHENDIVSEKVERADLHTRVRNCLRRVPRPYRRALEDFYVRGCSVDRIARAHRVPKGTVGSRLHTAKRLLRAAWASQ